MLSGLILIPGSRQSATVGHLLMNSCIQLNYFLLFSIAYFHLARLYDKYFLPDNPEQKVRNKMQTYFCYNHVVEYCHKHPAATEIMQTELPLCEEMVVLLPRKIQKMQQELL